MRVLSKGSESDVRSCIHIIMTSSACFKKEDLNFWFNEESHRTRFTGMPELHIMEDDQKEATWMGQIKLKRVASLQHLLDPLFPSLPLTKPLNPIDRRFE